MFSKKYFDRRTKIVATYGPSCEGKEKIKELIEAGVNFFRLNASHSAEYDMLKDVVSNIRSASEDCNRHVGIFMDLQGPKIRVGKFLDGKTTLEADSRVSIYVTETEGTSSQFQVDYSLFLKDVQVGDPVFIDDGKIKGVIEEIKEDCAICRITVGGVVSNNKGVNLPCTKLSMSALTEKDKRDVQTAVKLDLDYIALSFVSTSYDLLSFKDFLVQSGAKDLRVISKIERQQAVDNLIDIIQQSDVVMVARGDLGVEIGVERVPRVQKQIIEACNRYIKPVIVATQMLESMIQSRTATRAEVSDVANAIYDHCDAVMLSGETAVGVDPVNVIRVMAEICEEADKHLVDLRKTKAFISKKIFEYDTVATSFCRAADQIAEENNAKAIMAFTSSGNTPLIASKLNSLFPIIAPTDFEGICHKLCIYRGVIPLMMPKNFSDIHRWTDMIHLAVEEAERCGLLSKGDCVIVTAGIPIGRSNGINSIRIVTV